jgi:hypothetical protein
MLDTTTPLPAPVVPVPPLPTSKWEREQGAFTRLRPSLIKSHAGQYVAIHEGQVVESGHDQIEVARKAYARFGYIPIYVGLISEAPVKPARLPSPRIPRT